MMAADAIVGLRASKLAGAYSAAKLPELIMKPVDQIYQ